MRECRTRWSKGLGLAMGTLLSLIGCGANGDGGGVGGVKVERVFTNLDFNAPTGMFPLPGSPGRWWLLEKRGRIVAFGGVDGNNPVQVVDIQARVDAGPSEAGLLGLAFHPDYPTTPQVFLSYTRDGTPLVSTLSRFSVANDIIDPASEQVLLSVPQPYSNHNGGGIGFGPDGYLYIGLGDGGSGGDPQGNGQNSHTLLGSLLRIDVTDTGSQPYTIPPDNPFADGNGGRPEVYAWGLRNPWRWSFDSDSGRLWLADVGQNQWEEVNLIDKGGNYGWNILEGNHCYGASGCNSSGFTAPVAEYSHDLGCSITGGYVYRGNAIPSLDGDYVFGDFCSGIVWALSESAGGEWMMRELAYTDLRISSFAQGADGEVYLLNYSDGAIYQLKGFD